MSPTPTATARDLGRILIVDDHAVVRMGLRALLQEHDGFEVVGEAGGVEEALAATREHAPDLVLLDQRLPDGTGVDVCRAIKAESKATKVVFLTSFTSRDNVWQAVQAGADGFLIKEAESDVLVDGLRRALGGETVLHPKAVKELFRGMQDDTEERRELSRWDQLSPQERRVLAEVAGGNTNKEIAARLGLSEKTVRNYLSNLMEKLGVARRAEAAAFFARLRLDEPGDGTA